MHGHSAELAELTRDYDIGFVAPPGEPEALADVLARLADQTRDLPEMGARARRLAEAEYDRQRVTPRCKALLKEILGTGRTAKSVVPTVQRPHEPQATEHG
jgi:glycosyltransferase involved in cell wall biosynthesis